MACGQPSSTSKTILFDEPPLLEVSLSREEYFELKYGLTPDAAENAEKILVDSAEFTSESSPEYNIDRPDSEEYEEKILRVAGEKKVIQTITSLSKISSSLWNKYPSEMYRAFKVDGIYIVRPNYIFSVSRSQSMSKKEITVDGILNAAALRTPTQRDDLEVKMEDFLSLFDDMKNFPEELQRATRKAYEMAVEFTKNAKDLLTQDKMYNLKKLSAPTIKATVQMVEWMQEIQALWNAGIDHISEALIEEYIQNILHFFQQEMSIASYLTIRSKFNLRLKLRDRKTGAGRDMIVEPDIKVEMSKDVRVGNYIMLVGEVKRLNIIKKRKADEMMELEGKIRELEGKPTGTTEETHPSMSTSSDRGQDETEGAMTFQVDGATDDDAQNMPCHYRRANEAEMLKIGGFLPQLIAQLLAAMDKNYGKFRFCGCDNESVQFGFSLQGFKLRIVRLVLHHKSKLETPPSLKNIREADVRCNIFMTKEFDMFHKRHLRLFLQMLYAILSYINC